MHPLIAYDLARLQIDESHRQADRARLLKLVDEARRPYVQPARQQARTGIRARVGGALTLGGLLG